MANFAFGFGNFTAPQTLDFLESGFVGIGGNLMVDSAPAVTLVGNFTELTVLGAIYSQTTSAVSGGTTVGAQIFVGSDGTIVSAEDTIGFEAGGQIIHNNGIIATVGGAFEAVELFGGGNTIYNNGAIQADGRGIQIDGSGAGLINTIVNLGTISTGFGDDSGAIVTNGADDHVTNGGTINGDVVLGGGEDVFNGTGGTVFGSVFGGSGDDLYIVDDPILELVEAPGEGIDAVVANTGWALGANFEDLNLVGDGDHSGVGNNLANAINGNIGDNTISGRGGDDILRGSDGNDTLRGASGDDRAVGGDGDDVVAGNLGNDFGVGGSGDDHLRGGAGDDDLRGGHGSDRLLGGSGDDRLLGATGEDVLIGGIGRDVLFGGGDADKFVYTSALESPAGAGRDRIQQFSSAQGDRIDLSGIDADPVTGEDDSFTFIGTSGFSGSAGEVGFVNIGANVLVQGDVDGDGNADFEIFVNDTATLTASDFIL